MVLIQGNRPTQSVSESRGQSACDHRVVHVIQGKVFIEPGTNVTIIHVTLHIPGHTLVITIVKKLLRSARFCLPPEHGDGQSLFEQPVLDSYPASLLKSRPTG